MPFDKIANIIKRDAIDNQDLKYDITKIKEAGNVIDTDLEGKKGAEFKAYYQKFNQELKKDVHDPVIDAMVKANQNSFDIRKKRSNYLNLRKRIKSDATKNTLKKYRPGVDWDNILSAENTNNPMRTVITGLTIIGNVDNFAMNALKRAGTHIDNDMLQYLQQLCSLCSINNFGENEIAAIAFLQMMFSKYEELVGDIFGVDGVAGGYTMKAIDWIIGEILKYYENNDPEKISKANIHEPTIIDKDGNNQGKADGVAIVTKNVNGRDVTKWIANYNGTNFNDIPFDQLPTIGIGDTIKIGDTIYRLKKNEAGDFELHEKLEKTRDVIYSGHSNNPVSSGETINYGVDSDGSPKMEVVNVDGETQNITLDDSFKNEAYDQRIMRLPGRNQVLYFNSFKKGQDTEGNETQGRFEIHDIQPDYIGLYVDEEKVYKDITWSRAMKPHETELKVIVTQGYVEIHDDGGNIKSQVVNNPENIFSYQHRIRKNNSDKAEALENKGIKAINTTEMAPGENTTFVNRGIRYKLTATTNPMEPTIEALPANKVTLGVSDNVKKYFTMENGKDDFVEPKTKINISKSGASNIELKLDGQVATELAVENSNGDIITGQSKLEMIVTESDGQKYEYEGTIDITAGNINSAVINMKGPKEVIDKDQIVQHKAKLWFVESGSKVKERRKQADINLPAGIVQDMENNNFYVNQLETNTDGKVVNMASVDKIQNPNCKEKIDNLLKLIPDPNEKNALSQVQGLDFIQIEGGHVVAIVAEKIGNNLNAILSLLPNLRTIGVKDGGGKIDLNARTNIERVIAYNGGKIAETRTIAKNMSREINSQKRSKWKLSYENGVLTGEKRAKGTKNKTGGGAKPKPTKPEKTLTPRQQEIAKKRAEKQAKREKKQKERQDAQKRKQALRNSGG